MKTTVIAFFSALVFSGCITLKNNVATAGSIPADLKDSAYVLLVQKQELGLANLQNRQVAKIMRKYYKGRYEMATAEEIKNDVKYAGITVYRYVLTKNGSGLNIHTRTLSMDPADKTGPC